MDDLFIIMVFFAVGVFLSGPAALIISIIALNRTRRLSEQIKPDIQKQPAAAVHEMPQVEIKMPQVEIKMPPIETKLPIAPLPVLKPTAAAPKPVPQKEHTSIEQQIGTKWVLVAGILTVIVGVGFFMKYAYDNALIGELGRVIIAVIAGLAALATGEITRKRGYDIVAKGVTALGFAILYAAVFSAYRFYGLIDSAPAFGLAILVTAAAMLYAVSLDEILIAIISLIGGFAAPVIVSTGENMPLPLFSYLLILGAGAMLCAFYRKWRLVNILAFAGTVILYGGWLVKFYLPAARAADGLPPQIYVALIWLTIFFAMFLVLPLLNGFIRKRAADTRDVLLVLSNAALTFLCLWLILFVKYKFILAFCTLGLCAAHLGMLNAAARKCRQDSNLQLVLLLISLFFLTITIPLYLSMYAVTMAWAAEAVILTVIGFKYRSVWTQYCGIIALLLSLGQLFNQLPMHKAAFTLVLNPAFGSWVFFAAAIIACHLIYRRKLKDNPIEYGIVSQMLYCATVVAMIFASIIEWWSHCEYNIMVNANRDGWFILGVMMISIAYIMPLVIRPLCPAGRICKVLATAIGLLACAFTVIAFPESYSKEFTLFVNVNFMFALIFTAGLFIAAKLLKQRPHDAVFSHILGIAGIVVLWILLSEQIYLYWYWRHRADDVLRNWRFSAGMYISVMWAVYAAALMMAGFWKRITPLRYISLGLFVILLIKVFIFDMSTVKSVYRIAAFLATGLTLVGVSYLYQFLKNKGFFEKVDNNRELSR